jgi:hypothetical protein
MVVAPKGKHMKLRIHKPSRSGTENMLVEFFDLLDRTIPGARTAFLVAGVLAAAQRTGASSDFLFATGLALQFTIWFESWWLSTRPN